MRLPESRFPTTRRRHGGVLVILVVALFVAVAGAVALFVVRSRAPIFPISATERTDDIVTLWNSGDYDELIRVSTERLQEYPVDETALSLRGFGRFYRAMQEVKEEKKQDLLIGAVQDMHRVLLLDKLNLRREVHYVLGKAFFHRGHFYYDSAIYHLTVAQSEGLLQLDMLEYLALAFESLGKYEDAVVYYRKAIDFATETVHKVSLADLLIEMGQYQEADELLDDARRHTTDVSVIRHALLSAGRSFQKQGRWNEAISAYEELIKLNPASADAHFGMGETYAAMGDSNLARFEWREAVRLNPNHIESLQRLQDD
jgi:tetratricopeptide (TPR) repeat protein